MTSKPRNPAAEQKIETVERLIPAPAAELFAIITDLERHAELDGSGMLQGRARGQQRLTLGSRFSMGMKQKGAAYRSVSSVVEYDENALLAWETVGEFRGRRLIGGQRWRYELAPDGEGTRVRHSYVWGYAVLPLLTVRLPGYPRTMRGAMARTLVNLERAVGPA